MRKTLCLIALATILFSYNLKSQTVLSVSADKMNVLYIGVDNPITIAVSEVPAEKIYPSISQGSIRKAQRAGGYIVRVNKTGKAVISVTVDSSGVKKSIGKKEFRVKTVPDPVAMVAGKKGGKIKKSVFLAQSGVTAVLVAFDFDMQFKVTGFTVSANIGEVTYDEKSKSDKFTEQQKDLIKKIEPGTKVYIEGITAVGPDGIERKLNVVVFKIAE